MQKESLLHLPHPLHRFLLRVRLKPSLKKCPRLADTSNPKPPEMSQWEGQGHSLPLLP